MSDVTITGISDSAKKILGEAYAGSSAYYQTRAGDVRSLEQPDISTLARSTADGRNFKQQYDMTLKAFLSSYEQGKDGFKVFHDGLKDMYLDSAKNYEMINRALGGYVDHAALEESSQTTMKMAVKRYDSMIDAYGNTTERFIELQREAGETITGEYEERLRDVGIEFITDYFKSGQEAAAVQAEVVNLMITQNSEAINEMDDLTGKELALIRRNTEFSAETIAKILESTVIRTGEATNDAFFKIAGFSKQMADETGLSQDLIQNNIAKTIANIEQFGFVTEKEAARISTQLLQLGMRFDTFTGLTEKFQDFSSSAAMTGDISQLTGGAVQLDAQELAFLASEDQDEFLRELRRSFLDAGFDKEQFEAMTNAEQRAIAQSLGMKRQEFMMLIDRENKVSSRAQLDQMIKNAEESGKTTEKGALEIIKQQRKAMDKTEQDMAEEFRRKAMDRNRKEATAQIQQLVQLRSEMLKAVNPPDIMHDLGGITAIKALGGSLLETFSQFNKDGAIMNSMGEGMEYFINMMAGSFEEAGAEAADGAKRGLGPFATDSLPPYYEKMLEHIKEEFPPGMGSAFFEAGEAASQGFEMGFNKMGMDPANLVGNFDNIAKIKTEPIMVQKNIEQLTKLLTTIQNTDAEKYEDAIEKLTKTIEIMNEYIVKSGESNDSIKELLSKSTNIVLQMDGRKVGQGILDRSGEIESNAGASFKVEVG